MEWTRLGPLASQLYRQGSKQLKEPKKERIVHTVMNLPMLIHTKEGMAENAEHAKGLG